MELLLSALGLIASTLQGIASAISGRGSEDKRKVGKTLSELVVKLDDVLSRAETILRLVEHLAMLNLIDEAAQEQLRETIEDQCEDVSYLSKETARLWGQSKSGNIKSITKVLAVFGDREYHLDSLLAMKRERLLELLFFASKEYSFNQNRDLLVNQYKINRPDNPDEPLSAYPIITERAIDAFIRDGTVSVKQVNLRNKNECRKYIRNARRELAEIKRNRDSLSNMLREHFEIEDIV